MFQQQRSFLEPKEIIFYLKDNLMQKINLALLMGGVSGEREVSLSTGKKILEALSEEKYEVSVYDPKSDLRRFLIDVLDGEIDVVFPALHGPFGEDGKLQGMLDMLGVPYVFSGCLASSLAMNKHKAKIVAKDAGVPVLEDLKIRKNQALNYNEIAEQLGLPIVVKPGELGSSVGMAIARTKGELAEAIEKAFSFGKTALLEKFANGRELTVTVMDRSEPVALPVIEIIPKKSQWFDYRAKYEEGACEEICPAKIPDETKQRVQDLALKVFSAIGCEDLARADFIWDDKEDRIYFLEINTIPGMTATSLAPQAAQAAGMEFSKFLDALIENNLK